MKKLYYPAFFSLVVLCFSCSDRIYGPALYLNNNIYQAKPLSTDSVKSANYISGGVGYALAMNARDNIYLGQLNFDRANTFKNFNIAYGVFGGFGAYENQTIDQSDKLYFQNKSFGVIGAKLSANLSIPLNAQFDLRMIGAEFSYSNEFGAYSDFKRAIQNLPGYQVDINNNVFTAGITSELAWRGKHNPMLSYAVRAYVGSMFGDHHYINQPDYYTNDISHINIGASFYMQVNKYTITVEKQSALNTSFKFGYCF